MTNVSLSPPPSYAPSLKPPRFQAVRTTLALMLREMSSTYGATPGGYIWAVLQPVGMLLVLSLGFSLLIRSPSLGTSFLYFYATGMFPFNLYGQTENKTQGCLRYARALLTYPAVSWIDAVLSRFILNLVTWGMVFCIVMLGVMIYEGDNYILDLQRILIGVAMAAMIGLGVGLNNAVLGGLFPVWTNVWSIATRTLFIASWIIYIYEDLPGPAQTILWWNPLLHITGYVRSGFFPTYDAPYVSLVYVFGLALILIATGLVFMQANYARILEK